MSSKETHILLLIDNLGAGGAEKVLSELSHLLSTEFRVSIALFEGSDNVQWPVTGKIHDLRIQQARYLWQIPFKALRRIRSLRRLKKAENITSTISFMDGINFYNILTKQDDLTICTVHGSKKYDLGLHGLKKWLFDSALRILYKSRKCDLVVTVSRGIEAELITHFYIPQNKIKCIYNLCDLEHIQHMSERELDGPWSSVFEHPVLINVGRLHIQKAQDELIKIFHEVQMTRPSLKLVILGDGDRLEDLITLSRELGMKTYTGSENAILDDSYDVYFAGHQRNPFAFMARSQALLFTSHYEGFPNTLSESLACSTPIVSSDCPTGPRELLEPDSDLGSYRSTTEIGEYGILAPTFNPLIGHGNTMVKSEWIKAVNTILDDGTLRENYRNKSITGLKNLSKDRVLKEWKSILR